MLNDMSRVPEEEQEVLADELHDGACQYIASAQMLFQAFRQENGEALVGNWASFDKGIEMLNQSIEELRRVLGGLQPQPIHLDELSVLKAVDRLIAEGRGCGGPEIEFCHDGEFKQPPKRLKVAILRIVQEALANSRRHSKSAKVLVGLTQDENRICIQIQDWGIGFDPTEVRPGHYGLQGIQRRTKRLGGIATIDSHPGGGTCITVELPLSGHNKLDDTLRRPR